MRDLLGDLTYAVRSKGLRGIYYSLYERYNGLLVHVSGFTSVTLVSLRPLLLWLTVKR